ncbi:hypothetical protein DCAR_0311686 [Daucus carota subsp. sativus]|uniref:Uncharacterized protein n=1 Tax=Daucus carota subsp. sativus TaxID=79200 RepID=A0A166AMZ4_DAUCS|nr:hypothetical protein DCAR_0311686 [Daucus carota subsp. sativus]
MGSQSPSKTNQIIADKSALEEKIKGLEEDNVNLKKNIRLMEKQLAHHQTVIDLLKKHIEERSAREAFIPDEVESRKVSKLIQAERKKDKN